MNFWYQTVRYIPHHGSCMQTFGNSIIRQVKFENRGRDCSYDTRNTTDIICEKNGHPILLMSLLQNMYLIFLVNGNSMLKPTSGFGISRCVESPLVALCGILLFCWVSFTHSPFHCPVLLSLQN